jgi:phosphoribosylformylglycinamidine cyclo-ligase
MRLSRHVPSLSRTLGGELLKPTRIYAKIARALFDKHPIKGAAHITGGGIVGNLPRVLPNGRRAWIERGSWPVPPIFDLIQEVGHVAQAEMDRTFNNGLGMIIVVDKRAADGVLVGLKKVNEQGLVVGEIRRGTRGVTFI